MNQLDETASNEKGWNEISNLTLEKYVAIQKWKTGDGFLCCCLYFSFEWYWLNRASSMCDSQLSHIYVYIGWYNTLD